ncbi:alanine--tRNA ligase [Candidatus Micrarchaeota archaeon CG1_02_55_22]|nr:MAG: alanine--tRNA ligase [Candidatus Micrarchaeota archaeon CG1_02_55_22]
MLSKDFLRKKFAAEYDSFYKVKLFEDEGFERKNCSKCGKGFWTASGKDECGDSSHTPYSFFRDKPRRESYADFWKKFSDFFAKRGHEITPRYPVISRWRDDLYFTIASIVDFQRLENGKTVFEYPANPLVVPQICLRFNDIANVGITGRHFSCFMMAGQHAFNCDKEAYWKDDCVKYNYEFLREVLEIPKEDITFGEDVWSIPDFSSFGPCIESFAHGSELVNSVFTEFRATTGEGFEPLDMKVIDVGWGFERLLWYYNGNNSAYDAVFPREIEFMKQRSGLEFDHELLAKYSTLASSLDVETTVNMRQEREKIAKSLGISVEDMQRNIAPMQAIYAIADHSRALLFALADGGLPSNAAGGYNLRVLARRAYSFMDDYGFDFALSDVMELHAQDLKPLFPELAESLPKLLAILDHEKVKYADSAVKAGKIAEQTLSKGSSISLPEMTTLYESHGVTPELLEDVAKKQGKNVEIPSGFYDALTAKHVMDKKAAAKNEFDGLSKTRSVYYEQPLLRELSAKVLGVKGDKIVLDNTIFYPEGGGQMADHGVIGGYKVVNVKKIGGVIVHYLDGPSKLETGQVVRCSVDWPRRESIVRHHTATHLMIQSANRILGSHVWQCGSNKDFDEGHVDLTHYKRLTVDEVNRIEALVNEKIMDAIPVFVREMDRGAAEQKYGFRLYQGGGAIGKRIRVVEIQGYDVQACGGIHVSDTSKVGFVKIVGVDSIQDGVVRLRYKAGPRALEWLQQQQALMAEATATLSVVPENLAPAIKRLFNEWKERGKELEHTQEAIADALGEKFALRSDEGVVEQGDLNLSPRLLEKVATIIAQKPKLCGVVWNRDGVIVAACGTESPLDASGLIQAKGAKGGGNKKFARGKLLGG